MMTLAPPVVRCTRVVELADGRKVRCRGWMTQRSLTVEELPGVAYSCMHCAEDAEILGGKLVPISRPASTLTDAELRRERHALVIEAGTQRRREMS